MLTSNIKFINFYKIKIKKKDFFTNLFSKNNLEKNFKLLQSFSETYNYSYKKKNLNKYKKFSCFRLIGMGGSILGAEAIYQFLQNKIKKKFIFINNLKPKFSKFEKKKNILNIIISKSGNTIETITNSSNFVKKNKNIFITEFTNNYLNSFAQKLKAEVFEHKNYIGGRYSVLSEVGMLPAQLMGLNEKKFKRLNYLVKNKNFVHQLVNNVKATLSFVKRGKSNSIILNYDEKSNHLFYWYQQLIAESLGKKSKGILPLISCMPKDNHSLLQLYLDGPKNNFFTFFSVVEKKSEKVNNKLILNSHSYLKNKTLYQILNSQKDATKSVFKKKNIPFRSFEVQNRNEESLGELFCFFVLETILLGRALKVNPFDQPSVELVKRETKKLLI